jgi:hypothetical protein
MREHSRDRGSNRFVKMKADLAVKIPRRNRPAGPGEVRRKLPCYERPIERGTQDMEFSLARGALQGKQQPAVEKRRLMIDANGIADQRIGEPQER